MADDTYAPVIELTTPDGTPTTAPAPRRSHRRRLLLGLGAGALVLALAVGLTGYLLVRQRLTDFATGTWDCVDAYRQGDQFPFVAVITDTTFTLSAQDSDDPLTGTWRLSGTHVVLQVQTTPRPRQVEVTDIPRWLTDDSYELAGSDGKYSNRVTVTVSGHGRRVQVSGFADADGETVACTKR